MSSSALEKILPILRLIKPNKKKVYGQIIYNITYSAVIENLAVLSLSKFPRSTFFTRIQQNVYFLSIKTFQKYSYCLSTLRGCGEGVSLGLPTGEGPGWPGKSWLTVFKLQRLAIANMYCLDFRHCCPLKASTGTKDRHHFPFFLIFTPMTPGFQKSPLGWLQFQQVTLLVRRPTTNTPIHRQIHFCRV